MKCKNCGKDITLKDGKWNHPEGRYCYPVGKGITSRKYRFSVAEPKFPENSLLP